jgi:hypothetical protein
MRQQFGTTRGSPARLIVPSCSESTVAATAAAWPINAGRVATVFAALPILRRTTMNLYLIFGPFKATNGLRAQPRYFPTVGDVEAAAATAGRSEMAHCFEQERSPRDSEVCVRNRPRVHWPSATAVERHSPTASGLAGRDAPTNDRPNESDSPRERVASAGNGHVTGW